MSNINVVEASEEMVKQLPNCPVCRSKVYLHGDIVDGFWFGWSIGCPRYHLNDGIHGQDLNTPREEHFAGHGFSTKAEAIEWWNRRADE